MMRNGKQQKIHVVRSSATLTNDRRRSIGLLCLVLVAAIAAPAQDERPSAVNFKVLVNFDGTNGFNAYAGLAQGTDGNLYATTEFGGANICSGIACGTVYKMTPSGQLTTIYSFCAQPNCADGWLPSEVGTLALGVDGSFYGATQVGGASAMSGPCAASGGCGTIFKIAPGGTLTTLYNFCSQPNCVDGNNDYAGVVRAVDGNFYGTTAGGGAFSNPLCTGGSVGTGCGTVFRITPLGAFTTIYSFCSQTNCTDGAFSSTGLVPGADGDLYGMTTIGGAYGFGTIFKITPSGKLTTLHSFDGTDGDCSGNICASMIQSSDRNFYGMANGGGANGGGTFFRITPGGAFTTLYNFCLQSNCADGMNPFGFVQGTDGNFYGSTEDGGLTSCTFGCGTLFKITPKGKLTTLHTFDGTDGSASQNLTQATNGNFYGTTVFGGINNDGLVFALSVGLGPFVEPLPNAAGVGATIQILGSNLTGATGVSFNGSAAAFTVMSSSLISATVPAGATTGFITVTGPGGTLKSNVKFQVRP